MKKINEKLIDPDMFETGNWQEDDRWVFDAPDKALLIGCSLMAGFGIIGLIALIV